jgi:hypothetical protein
MVNVKLTRGRILGVASRAAPHPAFSHLLPFKVQEKANAMSRLPPLMVGEGGRRADEGTTKFQPTLAPSFQTRVERSGTSDLETSLVL